MCENFSKTRTCPSHAKNIPTCQNSALGSSSFFNQFCTYKHIYILELFAARLLHDVSRANNNRFAALVYFKSVLRSSEFEKKWKFRFLCSIFIKFCTVMIT